MWSYPIVLFYELISMVYGSGLREKTGRIQEAATSSPQSPRPADPRGGTG